MLPWNILIFFSPCSARSFFLADNFLHSKLLLTICAKETFEMWMPLYILCFHRWIELLEEIPKLLVPGLVSFQVQCFHVQKLKTFVCFFKVKGCPRLIRQGKLVWKLIFVFGGAGTLLYTEYTKASTLVPASNEIPGFIAGLLQQCYCSCIPELMYSSTRYMRKCVKTFSNNFASTCTPACSTFLFFLQAYLTRNEQREGVLLLFKTVSYMLYFFLV